MTTRLTVIGLHGRDQTADYLAEHLVAPLGRFDVDWVLPSAPRSQWYSGKASDPVETNEAELVTSLDLLAPTLAEHPPDATVLIGFSQGACVIAELLARRPDAYAGVVLLTGTLLGPRPSERQFVRDLTNLPVVIGLGSNDPWMSVQSAIETSAALARAGAKPAMHVTDSTEHLIHPDDLASTAELLDSLLDSAIASSIQGTLQ